MQARISFIKKSLLNMLYRPYLLKFHQSKPPYVSQSLGVLTVVKSVV